MWAVMFTSASTARPADSWKLLCGVTTFLTSCRGVKRLGRPAVFPNMKTAYCSYSYQPLTPTAACATLLCSRSLSVVLPCYPMTCCVTLVCNTALSLIRGYFITSFQTCLSVLLSSSFSPCPSLLSSPQLSVLPTCQSQLDVIPVACAVLIDLASPPLRKPLQLSHLSDASSICYLTVNEVSSSPIKHIQSISNCSPSFFLLLLSAPPPPSSLPTEDLRSVIMVQALLFVQCME